MRLIDADALKKLVAGWACFIREDCDTLWTGGIEEAIDNVPTAEERKTGKWRICTEEIEETFHTGSRCTVCNYWKPMGIWKYCPNCGARMEESDGRSNQQTGGN